MNNVIDLPLARASRRVSADLLNAIVRATSRDWIQQAALLLSVVKYLANANGGIARAAIASILLEMARELDPDVLSAPARLQ